MYAKHLLVLLMTLMAGAADSGTLKACVPAHPSAPFRLSEAEGQAQRLIALAVGLQGDFVEFLSAPWVRCLAGMHESQYDMIVGVEPDPDFYSFIAFPRKASKIDTSRRLGTVEYVVVQKVGAVAAWDGKAFKHMGLPLIVPRSIPVVLRRLAQLGVEAKGFNYDPGRFVSMLLRGRADAVVLRRHEATLVLSRGSFPGLTEVQEHPLVATDVYLGFRPSLLKSKPGYADAIWRDIGRIRSSPSWPANSGEAFAQRQ